MFQLVWDMLKLRICKVWEDERWWPYFQKTYLSVSESNGALPACWWNGPLCPHYKPGITPSWQPAESCNSKFKRDVLNVEIEDSEAPEKSHTAIVEAIYCNSGVDLAFRHYGPQWRADVFDGV